MMNREEELQLQIRSQREEYVKMLKESICVVDFTKVNGDFRKMTCTLEPNILEENLQVVDYYNKTGKKPNDNVIAAWDINAKGWRSFRVDSIIDFVKGGVPSGQ